MSTFYNNLQSKYFSKYFFGKSPNKFFNIIIKTGQQKFDLTKNWLFVRVTELSSFFAKINFQKNWTVNFSSLFVGIFPPGQDNPCHSPVGCYRLSPVVWQFGRFQLCNLRVSNSLLLPCALILCHILDA